MTNGYDDFVDYMEQMDIGDDDTVTCPHCRSQHVNIIGHRLFISQECPLCCQDSSINYSLPCGHVYCPECFVKLGGIATTAASSTTTAASSSTTASLALTTWMFPKHSDMTYEKNKGRQLTPAWQRNKRQTYDRQVKLMQLLKEQKLDNNGLKDILFYIDERNEMPASLCETIGYNLQSEFFREMFENHYKIYMGTHLIHTFLSSTHEMYETCKRSNEEYNNCLEKLYKMLKHLDWRDTLSDLIYRYNNNEYKNIQMNMDVSLKCYCMKGHHFVEKCKYWIYLNRLYWHKCKDCIDCVQVEPTHLL